MLKIPNDTLKMMQWQDLFHNSETDFVLIFGQRSIQLSKFLQQLIGLKNDKVVVIDIHRNWASHSITDETRIVQPKDLDGVLDTISSLRLFVNPRLKLIIIDNLPLYFRDFWDTDQISTQNQRLYGYSLSVLKNLSDEVKIIVTSYSKGIDINEPFMEDISKYYCDDIVQVISRSNNLVLKSKLKNWELTNTNS